MDGRSKGARSSVAACALVLLLAMSSLAMVAGCGVDSRAESTVASATVAPIPADIATYVPGQLVVTLADEGESNAGLVEAARRDLLAAGAKAAESLAQSADDSGTVLLVRLADADCSGNALADAARLLGDVANVRSVQPNYRYSSSADGADAATRAQDGDVYRQYYLNGWDDHGADVASAWAEVGTDRMIDVAVLDTGVYVMQDRGADGELTVSNQGFHQEFDERNLDIDHAVDFVHTQVGEAPVSLVNRDNPYGDDNGHGTHISALIAALAKTDSTPDVLPVGMAGVSQNARVVPVKVLDASGEGDTADFIRAYDYLLGKVRDGELKNLHVINMSLSLSFGDGEGSGGKDGKSAEGLEADGDYGALILESGVVENPSDDQLEKKIEQAARLGIATVCAAGNEGSAAKTFPSDFDACISVTALDRDGRDADYSNINQYKDISAPGTGIYSAWGSQADAYATLDGTSQATAIVSGVLSMMWAKDPSLTVKTASDVIYGTANQVAGGSEDRAMVASPSSGGDGLSPVEISKARNGSHGAIDAAAAVARVGGDAADAGGGASAAGDRAESEDAANGSADRASAEKRNPSPVVKASAADASAADASAGATEQNASESNSAPITAILVIVIVAVCVCAGAIARWRSNRRPPGSAG